MLVGKYFSSTKMKIRPRCNKRYVNDVNDCLGQFPWKKLPCVKNLGVIFDSELTFDRQVNAVVKNHFFNLKVNI